MRLRFTKMQGAGNDFVVLDATCAPIALTGEQLRRLGDRRFGIGCDQILMVGPSPAPGIDFGYRIFNGGSGDEVEHCGNGARCFMRYVHDKRLADKRVLRVRTMNATLELRLQDDGRVSVDMNAPVFEPARVPFDADGLRPREVNGFPMWPVEVGGGTVELAVLSMGNPHAVQLVGDVDAAPVATLGAAIEAHARFPRHVNAGFLEVVDRGRIRLRVFERGAGETLACGTGACAAVVAGICLGLLDARVDVETRGGLLTIEWGGGQPIGQSTGPMSTARTGSGRTASGPTASRPTSGDSVSAVPMNSGPMNSGPMNSGPLSSGPMNSDPPGSGPMSRDRPVLMTGPAETVYEGEIEL